MPPIVASTRPVERAALAVTEDPVTAVAATDAANRHQALPSVRRY
jgi:hypothetical protein